MKKSVAVLSLMAFVLLLTLVVGCGQKSDSASEADSAAKITAHDCDGGCGMKDVPVDQLTEIDGKYYCAGCKDKVEKDDHAGHGHG